jgi:AcrR family transcriptional regulator
MIDTSSALPTEWPRGRPRVDRATVIAAGRDLLDAEGVVAFSMARLGERLGITAMALYRHVADRLDLERGIMDLVLADLIDAPHPGTDWAEAVATWMRQVRQHWLRHPWLRSLIGAQPGLAPAWVLTLDRLADPLEEAGFPMAVVAREVVRISRLAVGVLVLEAMADVAHSVEMGVATLPQVPEPARRRWTALLGELADYSDDDLFEDLITETVARLHRAQVA